MASAAKALAWNTGKVAAVTRNRSHLAKPTDRCAARPQTSAKPTLDPWHTLKPQAALTCGADAARGIP